MTEKTKNFIKKLLEIYLLPISKAMHYCGTDKILSKVCEIIEPKGYYITFRIKSMSNCSATKVINSKKKLGIVLQGPIVNKENGTIDSIKFYKSMYPDACIILSTWKDENQSLLCDIKSYGVEVVLSEKPNCSGILNINYQIISSLAGVLMAKKLGCEYVAKTRTDQRICRKDVFYSLEDMLDLFPSNNKEVIRSRIIALPTYFGNMFTPYFISDFFFFGEVDMIERLFSIELDNREMINDAEFTRRQCSISESAPEIYIIKHMLSNVRDKECDNTIEDYWSVLKDYFIMVDKSFVGFWSDKYWYSRMEHVNDCDNTINGKNDVREGFSFIEWMNLYTGRLIWNEEYEKRADVLFKQ